MAKIIHYPTISHPLPFQDTDQLFLRQTFSLIVNLPNNLTALGFTRTSLLRMGALTQNGVWDAGFKGKGEFILTVNNPHGIRLKQNARLVQLVFLGVDETEEYQGIHKQLK